MQVYNASITVL